MRKVISCEFNIDTGCVEAKFTDGSMIAVNCTAVENEVAMSAILPTDEPIIPAGKEKSPVVDMINGKRKQQR